MTNALLDAPPAPTTLLDPPLAPAEKHRLCGFHDEIDMGSKALLFGHLVRLAEPIVKHYQSDLYHDALWIGEHVTGPCTFWWVPRECGTWLSDDREFMVTIRSSLGSDRLHRFDVTVENRCWYVTITQEAI